MAAGVESCPGRAAGCGGAAAFLAFLAGELMPFIGERYAVDPGNVTFLGHSMGGLFGGWVLFNRPETFRNYILGSPYFKWDDRTVLDDEERYAARRRDLPARVYMAVGGFEENPGVPYHRDEAITHYRLMKDRLLERQYEGLELITEVLPGELHVSALGVTAVRGLRALFAPTHFQAHAAPVLGSACEGGVR